MRGLFILSTILSKQKSKQGPKFSNSNC